MNHQNMMHQFFDQQQQQQQQSSSMNGFPGPGFQPNQQIPNSYNGPTGGPNPFMGSSSFRQQNGLSRFGMNESDNFDMQTPPSSTPTQQGFPNFMDPRLGGYDPRNRPNFDPNNMMPGMEYGGNSNYSAKMRMNEMAAMFGNPAAMAALQRQRMTMFGQGRDNDFMSPTNPYSGFNPQQAAQIMQQQRAAAFQRQVQEQIANQHMPSGNRNSDLSRPDMTRPDMTRPDISRPDISRQDISRSDMSSRADMSRPDITRPTDISRQEINRQDMARQYSSPSGSVSGSSTGNGPVPDSSFNQNSQDGFSAGFSPQSRQTVPHGSDGSNPDIPPNQGVSDHRPGGNSSANKNALNESPISNKYPNPPSGSSTPRMPFDQQGNESQRNAALLAAAAVRAAAAASTRARGGFPASSSGGGNNYPFALRGYPSTMDQMPSPYPSQGMQSPEYGGVMSPVRECAPNPLSQSPINQGRGTPRNGNPPPYSPISHNESNLSASSTTKVSYPNTSTNVQKNISNAKSDETVTAHGQNLPFEGGGASSGGSLTPKSITHNDSSSEKGSETNHATNDRSTPATPSCNSNNSNIDSNNVTNNSFNDGTHNNINNNNISKLSAPSTPMPASSPSPSPFHDDVEIDNLSPSWPQTPLSPSAQKLLKAQASPKHYDQLSKVYDLIDDEEKRNFLDRYLAFMSVNGTPVTKLPVISKQPLDLYTLFRAVCERGGIQEVMEKRRFKEILTCLNLPIGNTLAYMVKEQYMKYLHAYEIKAKDVLLKQWKNSITLTNDASSKQESVPTIALNDSFRPDVKPQPNQNQHNNSFHGNSTDAVSSWNQNMFPSSSAPTSSMTSSSDSNQYGPHMSYPNPPPPNQGLPTFGQPGYSNQDIPSGYPGYPGYQNPMYPRGPMQNYNSMHPNMPNENMPGSWPRGFPPRQGPPELFPEGLQRMPWSQASPRHPMSAFSSPAYQSGKTKGSMPPISRDSMEHMKYSAQQQQLKMQQFQHQQQQMQKQRFANPDAGKISKVSRVTVPEARPAITPAQPTKREFNFPAGSVEATKPILKKRKKLTSKELGPVEAWRIMMSLKSGLVAECTWAIDTLNILLADNNTITYFHLNQLPGLLDTLMDHYRRSISDLFHAFTELEIPLLPEMEKNASDTTSIDQKLIDLWVGVCKNSKTSYTSNIASSAVLNCSTNERLNSGKQFWEKGGGDCTSHVQTSFPTQNVALKSFPEGVLYVTKAEAEKQRRLEKFRKVKEKARLSAANKASTFCENSDLNNAPKSPVIAYLSPEATSETKNLKSDYLKNDTSVDVKPTDNSEEVSTTCLGVLDDLLTECEQTTDVVDKEDPLIDKILADLEFNIPCDKRYLEESKEFIEYLNRRLSLENRGNVVSEQCVVKQSTPLVDVSESEQCLIHRCVALSNVFRSLSFIQGNDTELASHIGLMLLSGYILLHKHKHAVTDHSQFKLGLDERTVLNNAISDSEPDFWWDSIHTIRENTLVMLSNIGGHLNLNRLKEKIYKPLIEGLLHWLVCRSSESIDSMPTAPASHALSAKKLALETLAKMTINSANIELVISSQPDTRLGEINDVLLKQVGKKHPVPSREFAIILLDNLAQNEKFNKVLASRKSAIRNLVKFVYEAEKNTSNFLSSGGRVQPGLNAEDICGTSISLLRRSVNIILSIVKLPCNRRALTPFTDDLLSLSTSQMIDTSVLALLAKVLFELDA